MSEVVKNTVIRFALLFLLITAGFIGVIIQILYLQHSDAVKKDLTPVANNQVKVNQPIKPNRGNILDANGYLLASSMPQYYVFMDTRIEALHKDNGALYKEYADSIAEGLSEIMGDVPAAEYRRRMDNAFYGNNGKGTNFRICKRRVNFLERKKIEQLPLVKEKYYRSGFIYEDAHIRLKPFGSLAGRTIGGIDATTGVGIYGLEKSFETYLKGEEGIATKQKVGGRWEFVPEEEAVDGCNVHTTLDAELIDICEAALRQRLDLTQADWGCCILMETHTGEVKAVCNLDKTEDGYCERMNHAVIRVEPGSTFKTISLMAALDDGKISLYDTIRVHRNGWEFFGSRHTDSHPKDTAYTVRSALAVSSNIAFAKMITESYEKKAKKFVDKLQRMGICDGFECEIPGSTPPRIDVPKDAVTLSKMSYGYSVELSPMQIIAFYNAIANDGRMVRPMLVRNIERDGEIIKAWETETIKGSICSQSALRDVKAALHDVVWDNNLGTAAVLRWNGKIVRRKAQSDLVSIAGKTGTAQILENGRYQRYKHRITFVGYFPEENPEYTCLCMINHPANYPAYDAGGDCGTVVRQIAEKTMAYVGEYRWTDGQWVWTKRR